MKSFEDWANALIQEVCGKKETIDEDILPVNVWEVDGVLYTECCVCKETVEIEDPEWIEDIGFDKEYLAWCGRSFLCCP